MQPQNQNPVPPPQQPPQPVAPPPTPIAAPPVAGVPSVPVSAPAPVLQPPIQQTIAQQPPSMPAATPPQEVFGGTADLDDDDVDVVYEDEGEYEEDEEPVDLSEPVKWQAQEYIHQEKNSTWFIGFGVVLALFMAVAIFLMQSWTFAALLVVIAVVILVLAKRPPRIMNYSLSEKGLHIGDTLHAFSDFRAFGVIHDGQEYSIMLIPTKRFLPGITVYFPEASGEDIVDALGSRLPMQELRLDVIDKIVRKLRLG